jgi:hypothetical protein
MAQLKYDIVTFSCTVCNKELRRKAQSLDYLGKFKLPENWSSYHVFNKGLDFCPERKCQEIFNTICGSGSIVPEKNKELV